jgi:hypothetical protein
MKFVDIDSIAGIIDIINTDIDLDNIDIANAPYKMKSDTVSHYIGRRGKTIEKFVCKIIDSGIKFKDFSFCSKVSSYMDLIKEGKGVLAKSQRHILKNNGYARLFSYYERQLNIKKSV